MAIKSISVLALLLLLLVGCASASPAPTLNVITSGTPTLDFSQPTLAAIASPTPGEITGSGGPPSATVSSQQAVLDQAFEVVSALKSQDMAALANYVHPKQGLRFSPYAYVKDTYQLFPAGEVPGLMDDDSEYLWGNYDGSGEPINLTFAEYYTKFIYDVDFASTPQISLNHQLGTGNSIDNAEDYYPGAMVVEFHFPGLDPQYDGMDWRSLRLVFTESNGTWYLVGIIHDQWTI
jgi:hypothetical protein